MFNWLDTKLEISEDKNNCIDKTRLEKHIIFNYFELTVHNQDDEFIPSFSDYILLLQFIRHSTKEDKTHTILETMLDYIKQIYLIISQIVFPPSY